MYNIICADIFTHHLFTKGLCCGRHHAVDTEVDRIDHVPGLMRLPSQNVC